MSRATAIPTLLIGRPKHFVKEPILQAARLRTACIPTRKLEVTLLSTGVVLFVPQSSHKLLFPTQNFSE